jgi:hypothetical protein
MPERWNGVNLSLALFSTTFSSGPGSNSLFARRVLAHLLRFWLSAAISVLDSRQVLHACSSKGRCLRH